MAGFLFMVLQSLLGTLFLLSGLAKVRDRAGLTALVANYRVLPEVLVRPVATTLPFIEIGLGTLLVGNIFPVVSNLLTGLVTAALGGAAFLNLRRGRSIDCGCFGTSSTEKVAAATVLRAVLLAAIATATGAARLGIGGVEWVTLPSGSHVAALATGSTAAVSYLLSVEVHLSRKSATELGDRLQSARPELLRVPTGVSP